MSQKGTSTFIVQRATAAILIPFGIWFLISVVSNLGADYEVARAWLAKPLNGILLSVFIIIGALHMRIGLAEIILDYIHSKLTSTLLLLNWLVAIGIIASTLFAVYNISFAG
ncbi:succinate dehydrogenase, hydrophobic membrane anchor protein [Hyphococcus lacteus]|uniref:Succinate dehydrogenase hydrophobic membrane anchor subunit n=1 Tax=Hyphococcus lacteus TaxID=3143536 RepID=A0ABV3Z2E1_9PROT